MRSLCPWLWMLLAPVALFSGRTLQAELPAKTETGVQDDSRVRPRRLSVNDPPALKSLTRQFELKAAVQSAQLTFAAEYCQARVLINKQPVLVVDPFVQTQTVDITDSLTLGVNLVEVIVVAHMADCPAVVSAKLEMHNGDTSVTTVVTDASWDARLAAFAGVEQPTLPAVVRAVSDIALWSTEGGSGRRGISLSAFENYEQWQQAKGGGGQSPKFWIAPGFEITQLKTATPDEGSWISLATDPQGRLTIGREDQGFLRMTLSEDRQAVARVEPIPSELLECRGLAYRDGWLYASANNSKTLFRFKLSDDGQVTELTKLREFPGGVGHGRNDLAITPDKLHLICGDSVELPRSAISDTTSPLRDKVAGMQDHEGFLLRSSLDGTNWALFCAGLRNPYGVAVQDDPFTFDADNEFDLGMPWYRPTRVLQLLSGGDYGYREATGTLPPRFSDQPDNAPPLLDIGRSSPTSVISASEFKFPAAYRSGLFMLDWTYGRVIMVHLAPSGAGWRAAPELFLEGKPLNVTDVAAGPDGAMYLITGGRKTQSALYRVSAVVPAPANAATNDSASESTVDQTELTERSVQFYAEVLARVELHRGVVTALNSITDPAETLKHLGYPDPVIRHAARIALERMPVEMWRSQLLDAPPNAGKLCGLLALARVLDKANVPSLLAVLTSVDPAQLSIGQRLIWLRILDLCLSADREVVLADRERLNSKLISGWNASELPFRQVSVEGTNIDYRRRAALLLAALDSDRLPELAVSGLLLGPTQEDQISGLLALRNQRSGWNAESRLVQFQTLQAMPLMVGGDGLPKFHKWLEQETLATLNAEEQAQYAALLAAGQTAAASTSADAAFALRPVVKKWTLAELPPTTIDDSAGDPLKGEAIFRDALCVRCHRVGLRGPAIGPDLTFVSRRFSRRDILESVLHPSKSVAENYRQELIRTTSGQVHTGRLVIGGDFRSEKVRLVPDTLRPEIIIEIDKKEIEDHQQSDQSPMPQGLLDVFTSDEITDLLAYLTRGPR